MDLNRFDRRALRRRLAAGVLLALGGAAQAAGLAGLIADAVTRDPSVLEAQANEEVAEARADAARAQHYPTLAAEAGGFIANPDRFNQPFRGVVGRVNLYAAGSIESSILREERRRESLESRITQTREQVAGSVAQFFLEALRARELADVEQRNLARHEKIVGDLEVVVANDPGRRYELVQAESRALQVRMRIVQYEKAVQLALSRLSRYTRLDATLDNPITAEWRARLPAGAETRVHPAIVAQQREADAIRADQQTLRQQRLPRVDLEAGAGNQRYARVVLNWSFFDRSADFTVQSAAKQIGAAEQRAELLQREVEQRSATAEADMEQSQREIAAAQEQIGASASVVELYELQFKVGRRSLIELVNAYQELAAVEASRVIAENNWRQAVVSYLDAHALLADWAQAQRR
ncbi:MAG TPA: TolC family protein [Ottowia sp.]|uniref:TolC family protein n=1 Tax=Ottowia sp. TaxID=1898956 RepID=UPI002CFFC521|nr:TolC family protein [Ottowia sp.]HMN20052.1 TolC family protein [Ottowia sp.]